MFMYVRIIRQAYVVQKYSGNHTYDFIFHKQLETYYGFKMFKKIQIAFSFIFYSFKKSFHIYLESDNHHLHNIFFNLKKKLRTSNKNYFISSTTLSNHESTLFL